MNFLDDAAMNPATPKLRPAPHKTGQRFNVLSLGGSERCNAVLGQISFGSDVRRDQNFVIPELHVVGAASAARVPHLDAKGSGDKNRGQSKHDRNFGSAAQKIYCCTTEYDERDHPPERRPP